MNCFVYIIKSERVDKYYIGSTENVFSRLEIHNSSKARWTKRFQPWVLVHSEEFLTRGEAVKRERFFKNLKSIKRYLDEIKLGKL